MEPSPHTVLVEIGPEELHQSMVPKHLSERMSGADLGETSVLHVTYNSRIESVIEEWKSADSTTPKALQIISTVSQSGSAPDSFGISCEVTVSQAEPGDVIDLGLRIGEGLTQSITEQCVLAFDSLTELVQYTGPDTTHRFLQTMEDRIESTDTIAYYYITPEAIPDGTLNRFHSGFDEVDQY